MTGRLLNAVVTTFLLLSVAAPPVLADQDEESQLLVEEAKRNLAKKNYDRAGSLLDKALVQSPRRIDLYILRALLEGHAARRAGERITEAQVQQLRHSCDRFETLVPDKDLRELVRENLFFHNTILEIAASARLAEMVNQVIQLPLVYKSYIWYSPDQKQISSHYHRQIVNALATGDGERAELVMKEHVFEARDLLVGRLREAEASASVETAE